MLLMKSKIHVFLLQLGVSSIVALLSAALVFFVWYPGPYRVISGGGQLFLLMLAVDVILGPLITAVVFNLKKSLLERTVEFATIGVLQIVALAFGLNAMYESRPVHLVFEYDRFRVIHATDIPKELLSKVPAGINPLPMSGPSLIALRPLSGIEKFNFTLQALDGLSVSAQPELWIPYSQAKSVVIAASLPVEDLIKRFPSMQRKLQQEILQSGRNINQVKYLPIQGRKGLTWTALLDGSTAEPFAYVDLDSF
ncbi:hypothetical protein SAMN05192589_104253 [Paracidovorax valerianellae]|uniref:Pilus assembly protein n=2 Tax=Paracidovorax valerianellae TaxID=187868 RepID=A0A1G6RXI1_9BURK|nr:hypothetical protein SAMN05192589_104253 [Paracidovorax valerianellae]